MEPGGTTNLIDHAVFDKPSGGLRKEVDEDKNDEGGYQLDADRDTPLSLTLNEVKAVSDQLSTCHTEGLKAALDHHWVLVSC